MASPGKAGGALVGITVWLAFAAPGGGAERHRVVIEKFTFVPAAVSLENGDEVEFVNRDAAPHTATADDASWGTDELGRGQSAIMKFNHPGIVLYHCRFHPHMHAQITVTE